MVPSYRPPPSQDLIRLFNVMRTLSHPSTAPRHHQGVSDILVEKSEVPASTRVNHVHPPHGHAVMAPAHHLRARRIAPRRVERSKLAPKISIGAQHITLTTKVDI